MNFKAVLITAWIWFPALTTAYETESGAFLVCDSPECTQRAKLLHESLNTSVDPCTDFYSYVCDRWESNHPLTGGRKSYDVYDEIRKDIPEMLSYILGNRTWVESNQTIIDKVATMYNACLELPDTSEALIKVLNESGFNHWPILTEENIFKSSNSSDLLRHMSISALFYVDVDKTLYARKPVYRNQIYIKSTPILEKIKKVPNIAELLSNTIKFLNPGMQLSVLQNLSNQLVEFSKNLLDAVAEARGSDDYPISQLDKEFENKIPLSSLLKKEFEKVNITLNNTETVNVAKYYCLELIRFLDTANPHTLYNYAGFLALFPYLEYARKSNENELKSRNWSQCITLLDESARDVLDYLYITNERNHTANKNEVEYIARKLIQAFNETLQNNSWIDNKTREAFEKELKAPLEIGYPDALLNMPLLEDFYKYVPYFPSNISFTEAFYYFQENLYKMKLRKFRHPEESNWRSVHSPREGRVKFHGKFGIDIEIPYPIFVSPIFQRGLPRSLNYGGIGGTIARELGSTFSIDGFQRILGRTYNDFMKLAESRTSCFDKEYTKVNDDMLQELHPTTRRHKSQKGTDQDLADNTGLQTAFKAYSRVLEDECANVDTRLTGLENITGMQLFFISNARTQCRIAAKDTLIKELQQAITPARHRVNEAVKNLEAFAKAFNCSLDSPMHPKEKCSFL